MRNMSDRGPNSLVEGQSGDLAHIGAGGTPWVIARCCRSRQLPTLMERRAKSEELEYSRTISNLDLHGRVPLGYIFYTPHDFRHSAAVAEKCLRWM